MSITAESLADAMGRSVSIDRYRELLTGYSDALVQADCLTVNRAAMFAAQIGHESAGLRYMREIASGAAYEGRRDLGNTMPGDGVRFAGRGPIQITGRHNYGQLSTWAHGRGLTPSPTYFVDNPAELETPRYGFLGAVWYWTVARPAINGMSDRRDLEGVTRAINGGTNGIADRRSRWNRCLAMGDRILPVTRGEAPAAPTATSGRPVLRRGAAGDHVRALQARLNRDYPLYSRLVVDGDFGPATETVVREFQRRAGIGVDGVVGPHTWMRLGL